MTQKPLRLIESQERQPDWKHWTAYLREQRLAASHQTSWSDNETDVAERSVEFRGH